MRIRFGSRLLVLAAVTVVALGFGAGCGDNSNSNDNEGGGPTRTPTPTVARTATPVVPTVTPTGGAAPTPTVTATPGSVTTRTVTFTVNATDSLQSFRFQATYPTAKGSFAGSGENVQCTSAAPNFTKNDQDNGNLILLSASTSNLTFPISITCSFDQLAGQTLVTGDIGVTVLSVTQNGMPGDTTKLQVTPAVS